MYKYQAAKRIKQIKENSKQNPIHKMQYNTLRKLKTVMDNENITVMKADKSKAMVVIDKDKQHKRMNQFVQDNNIPQIKKDPTTKYHKETQQAIQRCNLIICKRTHKFLTNTQAKAPKLNAHIKTHKDGMPIRPVINNTHAPSHRLAKFLNNKLKNTQILPNTYNITNTIEIAEELTNLHINKKIN